MAKGLDVSALPGQLLLKSKNTENSSLHVACRMYGPQCMGRVGIVESG